MNRDLERRFFLLMLVLVTGLFFYLLKPFFGALFWACAIGVLFNPLQKRLLKLWGDRPNLTALATLLICVVIVVIPVLMITASFLQEGLNLYQRIQSGDIDPGAYFERIKSAFPAIQGMAERLGVDLDNAKQKAAEFAVTATRWLAQNAISLGQDTFRFFLNLVLMLYVAYFLLRDGRKLVDMLIRALPMGDDRERLLFTKFAEVTRATVKGNLVVALVQGALGGIIFWILDIPGALLWGVVMAILSLIPAVGAGLVWAPVAIYLFAVGDWIQGTVLAAYGIVVIGLADNILRPILVGRDTKLPDWLVLLSTLGGLAMFGINGFVIGPLIAALFTAFWGIFVREFNTGASDTGNRRDDAGTTPAD